MKHRWFVVVPLVLTLAACSGAQQRQAQSSAQDAVLASSVMAKLVGVDVDASTAIHVSANGGSVTLTGQARSMEKKASYLRAAQSVDGVETVVDRIAVNPQMRGLRGQTGDAVLATKVAGAIAAQAGINVFHVATTARDGVVTLRGTVPTKAIAQTILDTARGISGVRRIDDRIAIARY